MRRWNGWGDDAQEFETPAAGWAFIEDKIGTAEAPQQATLDDVIASVPESTLPDHRLITTDAEERIRHAAGQSFADWVAMRWNQFTAFPDGVAYPETSADVRELLDWAAEHDVVLIPYGGGTSVVGHLTPLGNGKPVLSVDMSRMSKLLDLDTNSQIATFGAGASGAQVEAQLRTRGYTLGHFPQSFELSTLGGWVVTRSSGQQSRLYGRIERMFAGGHLETPIGSWDIPDIPASGAGNDVREMVLGSEGRIGFVTEVKVRVTRLHDTEHFHTVFFKNWDQAQLAVRELAQSNISMSMLRLSNATETETQLVLAGHKRLIALLQWYLRKRGAVEGKCMLLLGFTGSASEVKANKALALKSIKRFDGIHVGKKIGMAWVKNRFKGPYLRNTLWDRGYGADTVETSVRWSNVKRMMEAVEEASREAMQEFGEPVHAFTHLSHVYSDGSSVYSTFLFRLADTPEETLKRWQRMKHLLSTAIVENGGTISHQHGVGTDHKPYISNEKGELGVPAISNMAQHFDPDQRMNPGKLVD